MFSNKDILRFRDGEEVDLSELILDLEIGYIARKLFKEKRYLEDLIDNLYVVIQNPELVDEEDYSFFLNAAIEVTKELTEVIHKIDILMLALLDKE